MRILRRNRRPLGLVLSALLLAWQIQQPLAGATLIWDSDTVTSGVQDGAGTWLSGSTNFWNGSANVAITSADIAQFGNLGLGVGGAVDVRTQTVAGLIFDATTTTGYTLNTTGTSQALTVGASGIVLNSGVLNTSIGTGALGIVTSGSQTWTNNSTTGTLTLPGTVNIGTGNTLTIDGPGNFTFSGVAGSTNSSTTANTGAITKNGTGTLTFTTDPNHTGALTINGGTVNFAQSSGNADFTVATVNSTGTLLSTSTNALSDNLIVTMNGGTYDLRNSDSIGGLTGSTGTITSGGGTPTLTVSNTTDRTFGGTFQNGAGTISFGKSNTNTVTLTGASTSAFGTVTVNTAALVVNGAAGSIAGAANINIGDFNNAPTLVPDSLTAGANADIVAGSLNRLPDAGTIALRGFAALTVNGPAAGSGGFTETVNILNVNNGAGTITLAPAAGQEVQVSAAQLTQTAGATALIRGTGLGLAAGTPDSARLVIGTAPTLIGAGGADGSTTVSIVPWWIGDSTATGAGSDFLTYNATNGVRPLVTAEYDTTIAGTLANRNVATAGGETLATDAIVNGLKITGGTATISGANTALSVGSAVLATAAATIAGPGRLDFGTGQSIITVANNTATTLAIDAPISGTNGLIINSTGTAQNIVQLGGESTFIGPLRVHPNTVLQVKAGATGALNDNVLNALALDTGSVLRLNGNSMTVGQLTTNAAARNAIIENASATNVTLTTFTTGAQTWEGLLQNGTGAGTLSFVKSGAGALTMQNTTSSYTGTTEIRGGSIILTSNAQGILSGTTSVILSSGGALTLGHGTNNTANRINNSATLQLRGGTLTQNGSGTNNQSETIGQLLVQNGLNTITSGQAGTANTENLTFASLGTRTGGVVNFNGTGLGANTRNRVVFTTAPTLNDGVIGGWAVSGNDFVKYVTSGTISVVALSGTDYDTTGGADPAWATAINSKPATSVTFSGSGGITVNTLVLADTVGLNLGGRDLTLDAGGLIKTGTTGSISNGTLTSASGDLALKVDTGGTQDFTTNAVTITGGTSLTRYGAGTLTLNTGNTYTGYTALLEGTTNISADSALGNAPTSMTNGHLRLYGGTLAVTQTMTLDANRGIESGQAPAVISIAAGTAGNGKTLTYNGSITSVGEGGITFQSNATSTNVDPGKINATFSAPLNLGGSFRVDAGTITAAAGNNVVGRSFTLAGNGAATYTQAGGTLRIGSGVTGDTWDVAAATTDNIARSGTMDLTGTTQLTANVDTVRFFSSGATTSGSGTVTLATNNDITAATSFLVADGGTTGMTTTNNLNFGTGISNVTTPLLTLGGRKTPAGLTTVPAGGTLNVTGFRERQTDLYVARNNVSTGVNGAYSLQVDGALTANLNSFQIGVKSGGGNGGSNGTVTLSSAAHNIETNTLVLGDLSTGVAIASNLAQGTLSMAGGSMNVLGNLSNNYTGTVGASKGVLNLTGGTITIGGDITKADNDHASLLITVDGGTLDLQDQARGDTTQGALTASQFTLRSGSLVDAGAITLDGRGVTDGLTFAPLDNALILRDYTLANSITLTGATANKGGIMYEAAGAGAGAVLSGPLALGSVQRTINVEDNGTAANDLTLSGTLSTSGGIVKSGAGTLLMSNSSVTYAGNTAVQDGKMILAGGINDRLGTTGTLTLGAGTTSGVLQLGDTSGVSNQTVTSLATSGTGTSNAVVGGAGTNSTLTVNQTTTTVFAGNLGGVGTNENNLNLVKQGTGSLTLAGTSTYTGTTNVQAGTLQITTAAGFPATSTSLTVGDTAEFLLYGTNPAANVVKSFSGTGTVLTVGGATGGTLGFGIDGGFNTQLLLGAGQSMSLTGTLTTKVNVVNAPNAGQDYILINGTDPGSLGATGTFNVNPVIFNGGSFTYALRRETNGGTNDQWILTPTAQPALGDVWWKGDLTGLGQGVWTASTTSGTGFPTNWDDGQATGTDALVPPDSGSVVHFSATGATNFATTLGGNLTIKKLVFETGSITNGVTIGGANTLTIGKSTVSGSGGLTVAAGNGAGTLTISAPVALGVVQSWNIEDAASTLAVTGGLSGTGPFSVNDNGTATGRLLISGTSATYTGATNIAAGRLILDGTNRLPTTTDLTLGTATTAATLQLGNALGASNTTIGNLANGSFAGSTIVGGDAAISTLTINQTTAGSFNGVIGGTGTNENNVGITKAGSAAFVLNGADTYVGATTIKEGTLQLGTTGSLSGTNALNVVANAGTSAVFDVNGRTAVLAGAVTLGGGDSAASASIIDTATGGLLTLGGNVTYDATNNPLASVINVNMANGTAARTFTVNDSSTVAPGSSELTLNGTYASANSATVTGAGEMTINGAWTLAGTNLALNKSGTGTLNINAVTNTTGTGDWNITGGVVNATVSNALNANDNVIVTGTGVQDSTIVNISGAAGTSGVHQGNDFYIRGGGRVNVTVDNGISTGTDLLLIGDTGSVGAAAAGRLDLAANISTGGGLQLGNSGGQIGNITGTGSITSTATFSLRGGSIDPGITLAGTGAITKVGDGTVTFAGSSTTSGNTNLQEGSLVLDYTTNNASKIGGVLTLGTASGAFTAPISLVLNGNAAGPTVQSVTSTTISNTGDTSISVNNGTGQTASLQLGAITRTAVGGTVSFDYSSASAGATTTNAATTALGWATVATGGTTRIAAIDASGNIVQATTTTQNDVSMWGVNQNVINSGGGFSGTVDPACNTIASLTFDALAASTVTIGTGNRLNITSGGILVNSTVGGNASIITGGSIYGSTTAPLGELMIHQNNTAGALTIASSIVDSAGITKSGAGNLTLSGTNTFISGSRLTVDEGSVTLSGGSAIGDSTLIMMRSGTTLNVNSSETVGNLGVDTNNITSGTISIASGQTLTVNQTASSTMSGVIAGAGNFIKTGTGTLTVSGDGSMTGVLTVNAGRVALSGASGKLDNNSAYVLNGGELVSFQDQTAVVDRISNTTAITLNNTAGTVGLAVSQTTTDNLTTNENVGAINLGVGHNVIQPNGSGGTARVGQLQADNLTRGTNHATALIRGTALGATSGSRGQMLLDSDIVVAPIGANLIGVGGQVAGSQTISIYPYLIGDNTGTSGLGNSFITDDSTATATPRANLRPLNLTTEYTLDEAGYNGLSGVTSNNVRFAANPTAALTGGSKTINSLVLDSSAAALTLTGDAADTLTIASGGILATTTAAANNSTLGGFAGIAAGGTNDYIVFVTNTNTLTISSPLTTANPLVKSGAGTLSLTAAGTGNQFTDVYLNQGAILVDDLDRLGTGSLKFFGGTLRAAAAFADDFSTKTIDIGTGGGTIDVSLITAGTTWANGIDDATPNVADTLNIVSRSATAGTTGLLTIQGSSSFTGTTIFNQTANTAATTSVILNGDTNATINGNLQIGNVASGTNDVAVGLGADEQIVDTATVSFVSTSGGEAYLKLLGRVNANAGLQR